MIRNILRENLNVILIPESGARCVSFRMRKRTVQSIASSLAVVGLFLVVSVQVLFESARRGHDLDQVSGENASLKAELEQMTGAVDVLGESMARNELLLHQARALAGLHDPGEEETPLGLGGPEMIDPISSLLADPLLRRHSLETEARLDSLMRTSEQHRKSYERVIDILHKRKEKLDHVPSIHPLEGAGWYSSGFGHRADPFTGRRAFHAGLDISAPEGQNVLATAAGVVRRASRDRFFGNAVRIDHGNGIETVYAHNLENLVGKGDKVKRGQVIARVGSTGRSTGPHLHYAVMVDDKPVNPIPYILPEDLIVD